MNDCIKIFGYKEKGLMEKDWNDRRNWRKKMI
jgi:hypothetical protein